MTKRAFDCVVSSLGLVCLSPLFLTIAIIIMLDTGGPVFFRQVRVGRGFRTFRIYKFRTMVNDAHRSGRAITCGDDPRITRFGRLLRKTKLDELPQLANVLRGDMSIVGPRPELPYYVEAFRADYDEILSVRPGITDPASLTFRNEAALLGRSPDPEETYLREILPAKVILSKEYACRSSLMTDLAVIYETMATLFRLRAS